MKASQMPLLTNEELVVLLSEGNTKGKLKVLVNAVADCILSEKYVEDFAPIADEDDDLGSEFCYELRSRYNLGWYDLVTGRLIRDIDAEDVQYLVSYAKHMTESDFSEYFNHFVQIWCDNCRDAFVSSLQSKNA